MDREKKFGTSPLNKRNTNPYFMSRLLSRRFLSLVGHTPVKIYFRMSKNLQIARISVPSSSEIVTVSRITSYNLFSRRL